MRVASGVSKWSCVAISGVALGAFAVAALAVDPPERIDSSGIEEAQMYVSTEGLTPEEYTQRQAALNQRLMGELPPAALDTPVRVELTQEQINSIEFPEPANGEPLKVGLVVPVTSRLRLDGLSTPKRGALKGAGQVGGGTLTPTADDGYVWSAAITSDNAGAIRVHLENFWLPMNAELYFYSRWGEAYGPYTGAGPDGAAPDGTGEFWTPSVFGAEGILQLRITGKIDDADLQDLSLRVTEVGHIGRGVFGLPGDAQGGVASFCPTNASCVVNTDCVNEPIVNGAELAVAKMIWIAGAFIYTCSGGLIADTVTSGIPYFLTANHCLSKNNTNLEAFFRYQAACGSTANCTGTWDDPPPGSFAGKTIGATVKATNRKGDFTLLQLSQNPPAGSVFLGWTRTAVANNPNNPPLYRVSHPSGSPQSYSDQTVSTTAPTCSGWPRGERIYSRLVTGGTEGGSSGSPVVNASSQIVGQLSGSCGTNNSNVCDTVNNATVDGAFAFYFASVEPFLDPTPCSPTTEVCNDGIDNDCDGAIDCADPDCTGNPACACLPVGASCTSNSQCCSNSCKGPPGGKTCK